MTAEPAFPQPPGDRPDAGPVPLGRATAPSPAYARPGRVAPSAADVTSERMLRMRSEPPTEGWRRLVFALTGGRLSPGPSARERDRRALVDRIKAPVAGCRRIAVVSRKGGVGKTTTTLMLGHTFASLPDRWHTGCAGRPRTR
jgi:putative peptide zinc metalloprotease protein